MGNWKNDILKKLLYPIEKDLVFLFLVWGLLAFPEFVVQIAKGNYYYSVLYLFLYFGLSYLIVFIADFSRLSSKILKPAFFLVLSVLTVVNIYCLYTYRTRLTYNFLEIIAATNPEETKEYLTMYIGPVQYVMIFLGFAICWVLFWMSCKLKNRFKLNPYFAGVLFVCSVVSYFINPTLKEEFVTWNFKFEDVADLSKYPTHPKLQQVADTLPEFVVVIIGESHAKSHNSLYGYTKDTNPYLRTLKDSNELIVFNNVVSPATNTSNSFKYILNTFQKKSDNEVPWYKTTNLIEVLKASGYHTSWFSNQAERGLYNNLSSGPARLCDTSVFIREFSNDKKYDAQLAEIELDPGMIKERNAVFYHLMGQHILFNERYPSDFEYFKESDYPLTKDLIKRTHLAQYDNATRYNDYTINKIIEKYRDRDAIIFYFPDHGLDVYESSSDYCGHALETASSQKVGVQIPFYVYLTKEYKRLRPEIASRIEASVSNPYSTDKFIFTVMDGAGLKFKDNNDVSNLSLFRR